MTTFTSRLNPRPLKIAGEVSLKRVNAENSLQQIIKKLMRGQVESHARLSMMAFGFIPPQDFSSLQLVLFVVRWSSKILQSVIEDTH